MLKKQTRSLQKLFLALLGLGATVNIYAVEIDNMSMNTAASYNGPEPISIEEANDQLFKAVRPGDLEKVKFLILPSRTHKPNEIGLICGYAIDTGKDAIARHLLNSGQLSQEEIKLQFGKLAEYGKFNVMKDLISDGRITIDQDLVDSSFKKTFTSSRGLDYEISEVSDLFLSDNSIFEIKPTEQAQIWCLDSMLKTGIYYDNRYPRFLNMPVALYDFMKVPFSKEVLEKSHELDAYLNDDPLSDEKFYEIMAFRTKDGGNAPFGEYLVNRYLQGKHYVSPQAMEKVTNNSRIDKKGRFGIGELKQLSKTPHLLLSGGRKSHDVMQHISEYNGNPRIVDLALRERAYEYMEQLTRGGINGDSEPHETKSNHDFKYDSERVRSKSQENKPTSKIDMKDVDSSFQEQS